MWDCSCKDWVLRLRTGQSLIPKLPLIQSTAQAGVVFFSGIRLPDIPGKPLLLDAAGQWQKDFVAAVFGSWDPETRVRHINEFLLLVPKKSGKSTGSAAIMLTALLMNKEDLQDFILVAPTQEVSGKTFSQAAGMVRASPALRRRFKIKHHVKEIEDLVNHSVLKVKSFSPEVLTGSIPAGVLIDELHLLGKQASADHVLIQLRGGLISNPSSFIIFITTQSDEQPEGVWEKELKKARAIRDGKAAGMMLPVLYEYPEELQKSGEWRDPTTWWMVNPNHGKAMDIARLIPQWEAAKLAGEEDVRLFASQHLNVEIGIGLHSGRWEGADFWDKKENIDRSLTFAKLMEICEVAVVGIDGGGLDDLLGFGVLGRVKDKEKDVTRRKWVFWTHAWAHEIVKDRRKEIVPKLESFREAGELTFVKRPGDDVEQVVEYVMKLDAAGLLPAWSPTEAGQRFKAVGVDAVGIGDIIDGLAMRDFNIQRIEPISQGYRLNGAIKSSARKLAGGDFIHAGTKLMNWCVDNAKSEPAGNAVKITKEAAGKAKIDPLAALFDCVELMAKNPEASRSIYEEEDIFV